MGEKKCLPRTETNIQDDVDAVVEFVHRGGASMLNPAEAFRRVSPATHPNCCANYEYRFTWNQSAQERLEPSEDRKWVDLSYVEDRGGRRVYFLEMGDADATTDRDLDAMSGNEFADWHEEVWNWKQRGTSLYGPFCSVEEAEEWMGENGAFDEGDD